MSTQLGYFCDSVSVNAQTDVFTYVKYVQNCLNVIAISHEYTSKILGHVVSMLLRFEL